MLVKSLAAAAGGDLLANEHVAKKILLTGVAIAMERWPKVISIRLIGQKGAEVHFDAEAQKADNWILERML